MKNTSEKNHMIKNIIVALVGMLIIVGILLINSFFQLTTLQIVVVCWIITTFFAIWAILIIDPRVTINPVREVIKEVPVEKQIFIDRPVTVEKEVFIDRPVIVEKEVIKEVPVEVERIVYKTTPHIKLDIPRYEFVGSTQTKTYHKRTCRFSKLIKNKYKLHSDYASMFKSRHFKGCKACINIKKEN